MTYLFFFFLLLISELIYFGVAKRYNIVDLPNVRSSHSRPTMRGGGVVFYMGVLIYGFVHQFHYPWFLCGLTLLAIVSFVDDIRSVSRLLRLVLQLIAAFLTLYQWGMAGYNWPWWSVLAGLILCVGIINAFNFMDGINGLTGGYSIVVLLSLSYIHAFVVPFTDPRLIWLVGLAVLVFCFFNFRRRAVCFAGDVGSVTIAFVIVFLLGQLVLATSHLSYIVLLAVYGVDVVLTLIHRLVLGENIELPHREHLYQLLANELRMPHVFVSFVYMSVQLLVNIGAVLLIPLGYGMIYLAGTVLALSVVYISLIRRYFHLHRK